VDQEYKMLVILKKEVSNLGEAGAVVRVKAGYGRNFLIPNGLAIPASESSVRVLAHQKRMADAIRRKELGNAKLLAERIGQLTVAIRREAGEDLKLFGAVTNRDVAEALAAEGIDIDRRSIVLDEPIKTIGLVSVPVRLHREVTAQVRVLVNRA
jgi:large subunit ribosomal protein L9